jgi:ABC-2 type transport system permease protein
MSQLSKLLYIAWQYLYSTYKDRSTFVWGLILPLIFTTVIGVGMQGFAPDEGPPSWNVAVVNEDAGGFGAELVRALDADPNLGATATSAAEAAEQLEDGDAAAVLRLPAGLSEALTGGERITLDFETNVAEPQAAQVVEQAVQAALLELSASVDIADASLRVAERMHLFEAEGGPQREAFYADSLAAARNAQQEKPVAIETSTVSRLEEEPDIPIGFAQASPGNAVIFSMFFIVYGASSILLEREQGTLRRLLTTPVSKAAILGGKLLGVFTAGVLQIGLLVTLGQVFFDVPWGQSPAALAVMVAAFSFAITSLGMLLAALVRTYAQLDAMTTLLIMPLAGLGGAMWPIEIVPEFMQKIALWLPSGWAMKGFQDIIVRGFGLVEVLPAAGVLVLFGLAFLVIGVWRFKYE